MFRSLSTVVLLALLALPGVALAQGTGTVAGRIVDAQTGETLIGANVRVEGTTLGAATNIDGEYRIIGIPVGEYAVTASYTGYSAVTIEDVSINNGYTRQLDFELSGAELGEVVVEYERPLIQNDAIGAPRVISGDDIQNLPVRGVANVAALQSGVVSTAGSSDLFIRGGREQEVAYYVDGVRVNVGSLGVNTLAVQEQEMLIGTIPARYGDVQSGVINITTKSGVSDFFGSLEGITSTGLDAFGYNEGTLSLGGPIVPGRAGFFISGNVVSIDDNSPYFDETFELTDDAFASLNANPQSFLAINPSNPDDVVFVPIPVDDNLPIGTSVDDLLADPAAYGLDVPEGYELSSSFVGTAQTLGRDSFTSLSSQRDPQRSFSLNGNLTLNPASSIDLRLGANYSQNRFEPYSYNRSFFNRDRFYNDEQDTYRFYGTFRQRLGTTAFYQIQGEFSDFKRLYYPEGEGWDGDVSEIIEYGDISNANNATASRYRTITGGVLDYASGDGEDISVSSSYGLFSGAGSPLTRRFQQHNNAFRVSGLATTQVGVHQIEFGGEFERQTRRYWNISAASRLANYINDPNDPISPGAELGTGVAGYGDLPFAAFGNDLSTGYTYYGYNFLGTEEVDDQDISAYYNPDAQGADRYNVAPYQPIYYGGYIQDKIEYRDLVVTLGVRADVFDNNTVVPFDIYNPYPIVRADNGALTDPNNDLFQGNGFAVPGGIESEYAVYFNDANEVIAYRDLDGLFFDANGNSINPALVNDTVLNQGGRTRELGDRRLGTDAFVDYDPELTIMPRVGVSFPVTDRALFFASYNVTSQRPTENAFAPFTLYENLSGQNRIENSSLRPEQTTQYELGFRQRVGERVALTLSGFYRTQENKIAVRTLTSSDIQYDTYLNADFTTTKGAEVALELRRTNNLALNANYTLSFAEGTGSDANSTAVIAWRGGYIPNVIYASDFDRRHVANITADYRFGDNEGPTLFGTQPLSNFGFNLIANIQSGLPYTAIGAPSNISAGTTLDQVEGEVASLRLPGSALLNLRVDRTFDVGALDLRAYVWVQNLLNTRVTNNVYRATGLPNDDGYLNQFLSSEYPAPYYQDAAGFQYSSLVNAPTNQSASGGAFASGGAGGRFYGLPRQIRLGVLLDL